MTRPAEEPGTPLEPSRKRRPRGMVAHDRIRLTGLLRKKPWQRGFFYVVRLRRTRRVGRFRCSSRSRARRRHRDGLDRPRVASALAILGDGQWARFVSSMLYPVGFIAVIDGALDEHEDAVRRVS